MICKSVAVSKISGEIVKSGEKFRHNPDYKTAPLPIPRNQFSLDKDAWFVKIYIEFDFMIVLSNW